MTLEVQTCTRSLVEARGRFSDSDPAQFSDTPSTKTYQKMSGLNTGDEVRSSSRLSGSSVDLLFQKLIFESSEAVSVVSTFDDLNLKEDLLRGIYAYSPSSLQPFLSQAHLFFQISKSLLLSSNAPYYPSPKDATSSLKRSREPVKPQRSRYPSFNPSMSLCAKPKHSFYHQPENLRLKSNPSFLLLVTI